METPEVDLEKEEEDIYLEDSEIINRKRWTESETRKLIALYKENENLWNIQSKNYRIKFFKNKSLQKIANEFKTDPSEVARKIRSLRIHFHNEIKKMKQKAMKEDSNEIYISTWPHFSSLLFLKHPDLTDGIMQSFSLDDSEHISEEHETFHDEEVIESSDQSERGDQKNYPKKWSDMEIRRLISVYKKHEILWNRQLKDYYSRKKKVVAIRNVADLLRVKPDDVTRKMHNLRTQFCAELRKIKEKAGGQEPVYANNSTWPYFSSLLFIAHPQTFHEHEVGLLDIDLCGPSVPYLLGLENQEVHQCSEGWVPVYLDADQKLAVMSIGFLLKSRNDSVVWRGPKKTGMIRQFLSDVYWQDIDYLVIDTPPGTSDEHITVMENLRSLGCQGAILVTTPQAVAIEDVRKELTFCRKTGIPVIGILENMSGYVCPNCSECTNIFSSGGGASLAQITNVSFLGRLPIDPKVTVVPMQSELKRNPDSETAQVFKSLVKIVTEKNHSSL